MLALARQLSGSDLAQFNAQAKRLDDATRSTMRVTAGKQDHLLRRLVIEADLGASFPSVLRRALQGVAGAHVRFELRVDRPNAAVHLSGS